MLERVEHFGASLVNRSTKVARWNIFCVEGKGIMRNPSVSGFRKSILVAIGLLAPSVPVLGQDRMILGPRQFETDAGGGAVLCAWSIYLSIQAQTAACDLARRQTDDAIDEAVAAIDEFILSNSSLHPTHTMLEDFKRSAAESSQNFARKQGLEKFCKNSDLEHFRSLNPDAVRTSVKALLAVPREPVMNPCL